MNRENMTGRRKTVFNPVNFALWLAESRKVITDFVSGGEDPAAVSRIAELVAAIDKSQRIVLVSELENLAALVLQEADKFHLKQGLLDLYSRCQPKRSTKYVKDTLAIELLSFLVEKSQKYLLDQTSSILKAGASMEDAVTLLHRINAISKPENEANVAMNLNNFCELYVDHDRWLMLKRDYYKHKHNTKMNKKTTTLNGEALDALRKAQTKLGVESLSEAVLTLVKLSRLEGH